MDHDSIFEILCHQIIFLLVLHAVTLHLNIFCEKKDPRQIQILSSTCVTKTVCSFRHKEKEIMIQLHAAV